MCEWSDVSLVVCWTLLASRLARFCKYPILPEALQAVVLFAETSPFAVSAPVLVSSPIRSCSLQSEAKVPFDTEPGVLSTAPLQFLVKSYG